MATVVTNAGRDFVTDIQDGTIAVPSNYYVGWGTGAGTAAVGDTTLFSESADEARAVASKSQPVSTTNRFTATITAQTNPKTITNAGLLTASSSGTVIVKGDFTGIPLSVGDGIAFQIDLQN